MFRSFIIVIAMTVSAPLYALESSEYRQMHALYIRAVAEESRARDQVKALLLRLTEEEPDNILIKTYLGSTYTLEGRDAWMPWNKMRYTERGMDMMEKALRLSEGHGEIPPYLGRALDLEVQLLCGITFTQVPKMFGRFGQGLELLEAVVENPHYSRFSDAQKADYLYYLGSAIAKDGRITRARHHLQQALELNAVSDTGRKAGRALEALEDDE